jgi:hypothetical protein
VETITRKIFSANLRITSLPLSTSHGPFPLQGLTKLRGIPSQPDSLTLFRNCRELFSCVLVAQTIHHASLSAMQPPRYLWERESITVIRSLQFAQRCRASRCRSTLASFFLESQLGLHYYQRHSRAQAILLEGLHQPFSSETEGNI